MFLHRLPVRLALLGFTVVSVVATSPPPSWLKKASTPSEPVALTKGTPVERTIRVTASQTASVSIILDSASTDAHFTVAGCGKSIEARYHAAHWYGPYSPSPYEGTRGFYTFACEVEPDASTTITFTNEDDATAMVSWHADASISGADGDEDEPAGAHVEVTAAP